MENFDQLDHKIKKEIFKEKIIDWIVKGGGGQLTVFTPAQGTADLIVKKRGKYEEKKGRKKSLGEKVGQIIKKEIIKNIEKSLDYTLI